MTSHKSTLLGATRPASTLLEAIHSDKVGWSSVMIEIYKDTQRFGLLMLMLHRLDMVTQFQYAVLISNFENNTFNLIRNGTWRRNKDAE